jgi:hypothetical protein
MLLSFLRGNYLYTDTAPEENYFLEVWRRSGPGDDFMFILSRLIDTVKLLPSTEYSHVALTQWLNTKYSNRVLHKVGLCIAVYDIISVGDGALKYGDGCVYIKSNPTQSF